MVSRSRTREKQGFRKDSLLFIGHNFYNRFTEFHFFSIQFRLLSQVQCHAILPILLLLNRFFLYSCSFGLELPSTKQNKKRSRFSAKPFLRAQCFGSRRISLSSVFDNFACSMLCYRKSITKTYFVNVQKRIVQYQRLAE